MDKEEELHFHQCILSFREYDADMKPEIDRRTSAFEALEKKFAASLPRVKSLESLTLHNQRFLNTVVEENIFANDDYIKAHLSRRVRRIKRKRKDSEKVTHEVINQDSLVPGYQVYTQPHNASKIRSLLHQIVREWSSSGQKERNNCFVPIINALESSLPKGTKILVPGSGLGRLCLEIFSRGYSCEGNEFSYHMLFTADLLLNKTKSINQFSIFPWLDNSTNYFKTADMTEEIKFPDISVTEFMNKGKKISPEINLSMGIGDFTRIYQTKDNMNAWDAVVTCFFLDTAPNAIEYIQLIYKLLKPGGLWVNHGPLLWHWFSPVFGSQPPAKSDSRFQRSIEFSLEQIKHIIKEVGFEYQNEKIYKTCYCANQKSMLKPVYEAIFFTCKKTIKI